MDELTFVTTLPAPITQPSPIFTPSRICTLAPIQQSFPMEISLAKLGAPRGPARSVASAKQSAMCSPDHHSSPPALNDGLAFRSEEQVVCEINNRTYRAGV